MPRPRGWRVEPAPGATVGQQASRILLDRTLCRNSPSAALPALFLRKTVAAEMGIAGSLEDMDIRARQFRPIRDPEYAGPEDIASPNQGSQTPIGSTPAIDMYGSI